MARSSLASDVIDLMICRKSLDRWWKTLKNMMKLIILPISLWLLLDIANNIAMDTMFILWEHELQMGRFRLSYHSKRVPSQQVWASSRSFAYFVFTQLQYLHHSAIHQEAWWVSFDSKSTKGEFTSKFEFVKFGGKKKTSILPTTVGFSSIHVALFGLFWPWGKFEWFSLVAIISGEVLWDGLLCLSLNHGSLPI